MHIIADANRTVPIGETNGLTEERNVKLSHASNENCNLASQRNSESSILPMENRKRVSTEELPDSKHLKLIEDEGSNSIICESVSLDNAG